MTSAPPHVTLFLPSLAAGGAERVMIQLANGLARSGMPVTILCLSEHNATLRSEVAPEVRVHALGVRRALHAIIPLFLYLWKHRPTVLLSTIDHLNVISALTAYMVPGVRTYPRITQTFHGSPEAEKRSSIVEALLPFIYRRAHAIVVPSRELKRELMKEFRIPGARIHLVQSPQWSPQIESQSHEVIDHEWFREGSPPVILGVGRLVRGKGFADLISAFAQILTTIDARLLILGGGALRQALLDQAHRLGVAEKVQLPGFIPNPYKFMRSAAVFVLSSYSEGLPGVLVQALAVGTPVIAADCRTGPRVLLCGGRRGNLYPPGDVPALAEPLKTRLSTRTEDFVERARIRMFYSIDASIRALARCIDVAH